MLTNFDSDLQFVLVGQLVQIGEVSMTNDLLLIVAETVEDDRLATFQSRIIDLHLQKA